MSSPASTAAAAAQRIERIGSHVGHVTVNPTSATAAGTATATAPSAVPVDLVALTDLVLGSKSRAARHNVFQVIASEPALFKYDYNTTKETQREVAWARLKKLNEHGFIRPYAADDFETAHLQNEALNIVDHSVNTLIGAQFVLFAGSIRKLGSETHQEKYLKDAEAMKLRGCFAMTELGHGSNVRGLETTATYDRKTDELVIHTPTETAQKYWIGGGMDAQMATVFAQLIVKGVNYGVHAVLVPLRYSFFELFFFFHRLLTSFSVATPRQTSSCPASVSRTVVLSRACMLLRKEERKHNSQYNKLSNGVSNARFWFNNVRVPRENLLNKYGDINAEGDYESLIADNDMRFAATIANLLVGRIGIVSGSTAVSKIGLATYPFKPWSLSLSLSLLYMLLLQGYQVRAHPTTVWSVKRPRDAHHRVHDDAAPSPAVPRHNVRTLVHLKGRRKGTARGPDQRRLPGGQEAPRHPQRSQGHLLVALRRVALVGARGVRWPGLQDQQPHRLPHGRDRRVQDLRG